MSEGERKEGREREREREREGGGGEEGREREREKLTYNLIYFITWNVVHVTYKVSFLRILYCTGS